MKVGFEAMLTGPNETGVGIAIRETIHALTSVATDAEFVIYSTSQGQAGLPVGSNIKCVVSKFAGLGRPFRIAWQQSPFCASRQNESIDVYHAPGYILPRGLRVPSVLTVFDTIAIERPELTHYANRMYYRYAVPWSLKHATHIVVPSIHVKRRLCDVFGVSESIVRVIPLGVSERFTRRGRSEIRDALHRLAVPADAPYLLAVGTIDRKKNFCLLLDVLSELERAGCRDLNLVIAGRFGSDYKSFIRKASALNLSRRVFLLGYVHMELLPALYSGAAVHLYPSWYEGFGLPPIEAMACGTVSAVSNVGALQETAGGACVLCDPDKPNQWRDAVLRLMRDDGLETKLKCAGQRRVQHLTWRSHALQLLELYRELVP